MESVPQNHTVLFETAKDFVEFVASTLFFQLDITRSVLNIFNTVDFVNAVKKNDVGVRFFALGSFFHSINFAGKEMSKFVIMRAAFKGIFFVGFL